SWRSLHCYSLRRSSPPLAAVSPLGKIRPVQLPCSTVLIASTCSGATPAFAEPCHHHGTVFLLCPFNYAQMYRGRKAGGNPRRVTWQSFVRSGPPRLTGGTSGAKNGWADCLRPTEKIPENQHSQGQRSIERLSMSVYLLDINVLVALLQTNHE